MKNINQMNNNELDGEATWRNVIAREVDLINERHSQMQEAFKNLYQHYDVLELVNLHLYDTLRKNKKSGNGKGLPAKQIMNARWQEQQRDINSGWIDPKELTVV